MSTIFFSQSLLDALIVEGRIKIDRNIMTLLTKEQHSFSLEPAFRIVSTITGGEDAYQLLGTIKTGNELKGLNAETYRDSIIIGDTRMRPNQDFWETSKASGSGFRTPTCSPGSCWTTCSNR